MSEKNFTPDPTKLKYKITLEVYENCQTMRLDLYDKSNPAPSYQEVVGVLYFQTQDFIIRQGECNRQAFKKHRKSKVSK